jgi:hypothetical protein
MTPTVFREPSSDSLHNYCVVESTHLVGDAHNIPLVLGKAVFYAKTKDKKQKEGSSHRHGRRGMAIGNLILRHLKFGFDSFVPLCKSDGLAFHFLDSFFPPTMLAYFVLVWQD